jgi:YidC/Oxa1 family membrane protein insertase
MQVLQPEMQKINDKYANRQDPDSQRMKQAEIGQLYKKNKVGLGGCFLPFLQFPIFMAVYGAVRRFPYTVAVEGTMFKYNWAEETIFGKEVNSTLFGIPFDLFEDYTAGKAQLIGIIVLVVLVCGTQFLSQFLSERRQKKNTQRQQEDIPANRRKAYKSQNAQGQNTMKYVMYMMIFMMGTFVLTSKAGLGVYWLIGNMYSMLQMFINNEMGQRKLKKMRESKSEYR